MRNLAPASVLLFLLGGLALKLDSESLTLSTSYPAPSGVYQSLVTTGGLPSSPVNTILARDAGKVGIGTASPGAELHVAGDGIFQRNGGAQLQIQTPASDGRIIVNGGTGILLLNPFNGGPIGIGTTNPQAALDVNGAIRTAAGQNFKVRYGSASVNLGAGYVANSGNPLGTYPFGFAFNSVPTVQLTVTKVGNYADSCILSAFNKTVSKFDLYAWCSHPIGPTAVTLTFDWLALGD